MAFNFFKKTKETSKLDIFTPMNGKIVPITEVPDPVFSEKMMGEGIALIPTEGKVCSPINGKIIQVSPTKHAVGLVAEDGTEILIHVGLETVALKGEGFEVAVEVGDQVKVGQLLINVDLDYIEKHASSIITPLVITNSLNSDKKYVMADVAEGTIGETVAITVSDQ